MVDPNDNRYQPLNLSRTTSTTEAPPSDSSDARFVQDHLVYFFSVPILGFVLVAFFTFVIFLGVRRYRASAAPDAPNYRYIHTDPDAADWEAELFEERHNPHFGSDSSRPMIRASLSIQRVDNVL